MTGMSGDSGRRAERRPSPGDRKDEKDRYTCEFFAGWRDF